MKLKFKTCKRWIGLCLSVLLMLDASGMQTLAAEVAVENSLIVEAETVSANDVSSDAVVEDVSEGGVSENDASDSDASEGDVSTGDVTDSVSDADVVTTDVMANAIMAATAETIASGTYYGMNWSIDTEGLLTIYGTYTGVWGGNDVKWSTNNADKITNAKVTATGVTATKEWFRALPNLQSVDFSEFDASQVTQMYWMFIDCASLKEVDLSKFEDADVTDLSYMFMDCTSLTKVKFGNLDTSKVTDMSFMFQNCSSLETLDLSSFDTSSVKNMSGMFGGCKKLSSLDISSFNAGNVTNMRRMFYYCQALTELDLSHFNASDVTDMGVMFYECEKLAKLNLSGFDMSKVTDATNMLAYCDRLEELWAPKHLTLDIALDMNLMTKDEEIYSALPKNMAESVHLVRLKAYGDYYGVEWYLTNSGKLTITGTYGKGFGTTRWSDYKDDIVTVVANPSGMTSMKGWFQNHTKLKSVDFTGIDTSAVTDMDKLFYGCTSLESVNLDALDTSQTKYMEQMFLNCKSLKSLDFSKLSTAALLLNNDMLTNCSGLEEVYCFKNLADATAVTLPVTLVDSTGKKYTTMPVGQTESVLLQKHWAEGTWCGMSWSIAGDGHLAISGTYTATESTDAPWLAYADQITSAKVTATGVTSTKKWFYNLTNLKYVDLSEFDSSKVTDMVSMFNGCKALTKLDLSGFNTAAVTNMSYMFYDCKALTELVLNSSTFNTAKVTNMNRMFYNCAALTAVDVSGFDTAAVTNMDCMFYNCATLTTLDVSNFNTAKVTHMGNMFYYCSALTELDVSGFDTSKVTDMTRMFFRCRNVKELDVSGFETSLVTKMDYMFEWCGNIEKLDMSKFDMANVVSATNMINGCGKLLNINTPKNLTLDVALPVTMIDDSLAEYTALPKNRATSIAIRVPRTLASGKYYGMDWVLKETGYLTISGTYNKAGEEGTSWRTGYADKIIHVKITATGVTETGRWFSGCTNLKSVDISEFDSSKVNSTLGMFDSCTSLTEIDFSNFNMSKVAEMSMMFRNCTALEKVDFSNVATTRVVLANGCFNGCSSLKTVDLSGFSFVNLSSASNFLAGCNSLVEIRTPKNLNLDVALPVALEEEELGLPCTSLPKNEANSILLKKAAIAVSGTYCGMTWTINEFGGLVISGTFTKAADTDTMWKDYADQVYSVRITAKNVTNTYHWFNNMTKLQVADLSAFDASKVTTMNETFYNCSALTEVNLSNLNTSSVKNMYRMFYNCSALTELDVSSFDTSKVTTMAGMFGQCSNLTELDVSNFDTSNVTDMSYMFYKCKNLTGIDVSKFNTAKVTTTRQMFYECSKLQNLDVSGFDTAKVTNTNRMFWCCGKVTALDLSNFDMAAVTDADVMLYGCSALKQIKTPVNLALGVDLPAVYGNGSGVAYKTLPKNTTESVLLKKAIGAGTYCGMDWIVEEGGNLTIYGAFGASADTDTMWKSYANQVTGVKITATGVTNTYHWFNNMTKMQTVDLSEFDSSKVTTMNEMFYNCSALQEVDASNLNTASVKNTYRMFYNCKALTKLDLSGCDFAAVTDATEMLTGCTSLSYINTPKNLNIDVVLPGELEDKERNIYTQLPKNLEESIVLTHVIYRIAPIDDQVYTGKAIKPEVVVYKGNRILTEGVDYTISYKNNTNAATKDAKKAPTVTVKGKTNYMGTLTATFTIQPKTIDSSNVTTTPTIVAKNGKVQSFKSTVTVDGKKLKLKKDYVIVSTDTSEGAYKEPGKYSVDIQGIKNYTGTVQGTLIILDKEQVQATKLKIGKIPTCTYVEGEPAMPTPTVSYKGKVLVKDVDYEIIYGDNDKAGKASLTIRGLENVAEDGTYVVGTVTKTFTIKGTAISKAKANYTKTVYYTGQEICPEVVLTMGETTLREGTDYSVSYTKNIKVGTGTITIKGQGGYTGTVKKTFKIVTDPTVADKLTVAFVGGEAVAYYRVKGAKPEVLVKLDGTVLELGKDYTVSYKNNKKIPAANVTEKKAPAVVIKGKGNYKFTKTVYFNIAACPVEELTVTASDKFLGDKKGYLSAPVVKDGTKKLKKGKDYEIVGYKTADGAEFSGKEEVANDTYVTVTVRGMGNYTGEESVTYRIATKSISKVKITAKSLAYNEGKPVVYIGQDIKDGLLVLKDNKTKETLQYGKDYKITGYTNNTKTGTATMTIVGCGEYGGTRTVKFKIVKYKLK